MRFVVIGGDAAGMSAASKAKRNDPGIEVVVLEQTGDVSYSACGIPYNIADPHRDMDDLVVRRAEVFRDKQGIDLRLGHRAEEIDRKKKRVIGKAGGRTFEISYDKLLIATGARARIPDIPGADLPGVYVVRSLEDGRRIKEYLASHSVNRAVIVGAGYLGLEMVEALHNREVQVDLVEFRTELLPFMPGSMAQVVRTELEEKGTRLHLGTDISEIRKTDGQMRVTTRIGAMDTDFVIIATGVVPNSEIADEADLELGPARSVAVDKALRTSDPDIFAAGDCADAFHVITGKRVWIPLALRANRGGWAVANNLLAPVVELPGIVGTSVFKVLDMEVARTGLSFQEAQDEGFEPVEEFIKSRSRAHAHPGNQDIYVHLVADKKTGRLLGSNIVGKEGAAHRIDAVAVALHAGMTAQEFFQCDMAYAPPFSPVWDPLLTAANQLLKKL
jgi:NADPH-dependent 2,4-dienoyl-CoA reductase/sulfur reductase-like enzyme